MDNLNLYNAVRNVPSEAKKPIGGGRLKGMTDINPMWRIKTLTEQFGVCGYGWKYTIDKQWVEGTANTDEVAAFCNISLYIKLNGEWSEAIPGTGGAMFVEKEKAGLHMSDECFKMALTDAISVACKALGFGADVYWQNDRSKYSISEDKHTADKPKVDKELRSLQDKVMAHCGDIKKLDEFCNGKWGMDFFSIGKEQLNMMLAKYEKKGL